MSMTKPQNDIENLTSAFLSTGLTARESAELQQLLKDPENKAYFKKMYAVWYTAGRAVQDEDVDRALQKALFRIDLQERRNGRQSESGKRFSFRNMAAAIFISLISGAVLYHVLQTDESKIPTGPVVASINKVMVPLGSKSSVELPDGTIVTLNAGSRLQYSSAFGSDTREVMLEGEGYFKVTKNAAVPFIVRAKGITVKALGTEFNVKAYPEEKTVQTTLVNGSVSIKRKDAAAGAKELLLKPKQTVTLFESASPATSNETNAVRQSGKNVSEQASGKDRELDATLEDDIKTELYTSWKDARWVIESEPMEDLAMKLQRRYDVRIIIADEALKQYPFNGILTDETLEQVLDIMRSVAPIDYTINKKTVRLMINPSQRKIFEKSMK